MIKTKFKRDINKHIEWEDLSIGDIFEYKARDEGDKEFVGVKICGTDYGEFIFDIDDKVLYEYNERDYFITRKLDCTIVEDYNEN